jgi:NAD(P)-dependent dehydrogenase (short-subunit alcohol dehydrogenase family)
MFAQNALRFVSAKNMAERLRGKVTFVTGAGSSGPGWGNGKAISVLFSREGAKIFALDVRSDAMEETRGLIAADGGECVSQVADVSKAHEVRVLSSAA